MRVLRRAAVAAALMLSLALASAALAEGKPVTAITILIGRTEIGLDTDVQLAAYVQPQSAADRSVSWQAMTAADAFVDIAMTRLGCMYVLGERGPDAFDCSGFVLWCIRQAGVPFTYVNSFGWRTTDQFLRVESISDLQRGDILVYTGDTAASSGHVGIYLGDNRMIDASDSRGCVRIADGVCTGSDYWSQHFVAGYRIFPENGTATVSETGVLRASAPGAIAVRATANDGSGVTAYQFLTVLPVRGAGTEAEPYLVDSVSSLARAREYPDACYRMTADVDLSAETADAGFLPIGTADAPFTGTFDGDGYAVTGLCQHTDGDTGGLFGTVAGGTVKNLAVDGADIVVTAADGAAGVLAGRLTGGARVVCCSTSGRVSAAQAGGIAGVVDKKSAVQNSFSLASAHGGTAGGVAGGVKNGGLIEDCYAIGAASGDTAGGVAGANAGTLRGCYYLSRGSAGAGSGKDGAAALTAEALTLAESFPALDFSEVWSIAADGYPYPELAVLRVRTVFDDDTALFSGGNGLPYNPYRIASETELFAISERPDACYLLTCDLSLVAPALPIGTESSPFTGTFDGGGHVLRQLAVTAAGYSGLFGVTQNAVVQDLSIYGGTVTGGVSGGLIGLAEDTLVTGCSFAGSVAGDALAGGLAGCQRGGRITLCRADATVFAAGEDAAAGGLAGEADGKIARCYAAGSVRAVTAGGLAGRENGEIENAFFTGEAEGDTAGGLTGSLLTDARLTACYSAGTVTADTAAGGIAGSAQGGSATRCYYLSETGARIGRLGKPLTAEAMGKAASFQRYDFSAVWTADGSARYAYPELRELAYLPGLVADVAVSGPAEVFLGLSAGYTAVTEPAEEAGNVIWQVTDGTGSAEVSAAGVLKGTEAGTVILTATASDGGGAMGAMEVTVLAQTVTSLTLDGPDTLAVGESAAYLAVTAPDALDAGHFNWAVSDGQLAAVAEDGTVTALREGTLTLTCSAGGVTASCDITVVARATRLTLDCETCVLPVGYSKVLNAALEPADSAEALTYASADRTVATVDQNGLITAGGIGETTVTVTAAGGLTASCRVTVVPYLLTAAGPLYLVRGERAALPVTLEVGYGQDTPKLGYTVSDSGAARVDASGRVTAKNAGLCAVTVYILDDPAIFVTVPLVITPKE